MLIFVPSSYVFKDVQRILLLYKVFIFCYKSYFACCLSISKLCISRVRHDKDESRPGASGLIKLCQTLGGKDYVLPTDLELFVYCHPC